MAGSVVLGGVQEIGGPVRDLYVLVSGAPLILLVVRVEEVHVEVGRGRDAQLRYH